MKLPRRKSLSGRRFSAEAPNLELKASELFGFLVGVIHSELFVARAFLDRSSSAAVDAKKGVLSQPGDAGCGLVYVLA